MLTILQPNSIHLELVNTFVVAARHRNYTTAGEELGCDPITASRQVRDLGFWLGHKLISNGVPLEITSKGHDFLEIASRAVELIKTNDLKEELFNARIQSDGSIRVKNKTKDHPVIKDIGRMIFDIRSIFLADLQQTSPVDAKDIIF